MEQLTQLRVQPEPGYEFDHVDKQRARRGMRHEAVFYHPRNRFEYRVKVPKRIRDRLVDVVKVRGIWFWEIWG